MATMVNQVEESLDSDNRNDDIMTVTCNWVIKRGKEIRDTVSTIDVSQAPERLGVDNVVSVDSCVALFSNDIEADPCMIDIKLTNNKRIKRVAVVSEATVLEFFKQCGEYSSTHFAEFVDEFEDQSAYIGEVTIDNPSSEVSIKFTKTKRKNPEMWLYGIKLVLMDVKEENNSGMLNFDVINSFLVNSKFMNTDKASAARKILDSFQDKDFGCPSLDACMEKFMLSSEPNALTQGKKSELKKAESLKVGEEAIEYKVYIDNKFDEMEKRLTTKMNEMETRITSKLDTILAILNK